MSTNVNTLFKPISVGNEKPTMTSVNAPEIRTSFNTTASIPTTIATITSTAASTTATTTTISITSAATTAGINTTTVPQLSSQKTNGRYIPPVFFIGATENKSDLNVGTDQELIRSGSLSLGHGERRLSTVFPEDVIQEANKNQGNAITKILLKPESSNRGLFGDGSVDKTSTSDREPKLAETQISGNPSSSSSSSSSKIGSVVEIMGYKLGTENSVKNHFSQHGTIVKHETINGKLVVQFEESNAAALALKSDGFVCEGERILVKLHDITIDESNDTNESESQKLPPSKKLEIPSDLYKSTTPNTNKLGSGFSGITASDKNTISISSTDKPKEVSLYTRLLEAVLGW